MNEIKKIIDKKTYRLFKGSDWPTYEQFVSGTFTVSVLVQQELNDFVLKMQERFDNIAAYNTESLSIANQQRQTQIFYDKKYYGNYCRVPWQTLGVNSNGNVFICQSPSWIPIFVGNLLEADNIYNIINSEAALKIRQEILAGRYFYCNSRICGFFNYKQIDTYQSTGNEDLDPLVFNPTAELYVKEIPYELIFDFDYTCNFKCPSCRTEYKNWNNHHIIRPINDKIVKQIKTLIIDKINSQPIMIRWCGGEPFMSEVYIELFEYIIANNKPNIQNIIQTNGSLFISKQNLLKRLLPFISELRISFDAGTEETYNVTRVGGQWNNLIDNIKFLKKIILENNYQTTVSADFVVQKNNYKDLPKFVNLCNELDIHVNAIQKMWNWDTWDMNIFNEMNVYHPDHLLYEDVKKYFALAKLPMAIN